jgi:hypothetical protein
MLEEKTRDIYNRFKFKKPIEMPSKDIENYEKATVCYACLLPTTIRSRTTATTPASTGVQHTTHAI